MMYLAFAAVAVINTVSNSLLFKKYQKAAGTGLMSIIVYLLLNGVLSALVPALWLLFSGQPLLVTGTSLLYAFALVVISAVQNYYLLITYSQGHIAVANLFAVMGSLLLSCLWGVAVLHESMSFVRILGALLIIASVLLTSDRSGTRGGIRQFAALLTVFITSGLIEILSKMHQIDTVHEISDTVSFSLLIGAIRGILFSVFFAGKKLRDRNGPPFPAAAWGYGAAHSVLAGVTYMIRLWFARILPITATAILNTGISIVFAALCGHFFWHEKSSKKEMIALIVAFAGCMCVLCV